ncbi:nitrous oxide-stimulated promoter family protein [Gudongella oleilytica]|uniref:nitrous oxide-stimulated promoter family protein n=1 Tax=Gudongella oleilytica TaxID=1582259 RepID=UPI002A36B6CE|nr:nitrous oxide-stimulated promoter family protein [Gudongella oleilytica]MDY0256626.1 nitrous oxide-stimulated promoter family protein [Gudongella oleilytica]
MPNSTVEQKKLKEKEIISLMISIYCKGNGHTKVGLCDSCEALEKYSLRRIEICPYSDTKTFCSACKTHCFAPEEREKIRTVMRYSGPRMLFHNPVMLLKHLILG